MHIRYCTFEDHAQAILDIFNDAIAHTTALYEYEPRTMETMVQWFNVKSRGDYPIIGAFTEQEELMGFASYGRFREQPAFQFTVENSIYLDSQFRGKGVARELMHTVIAVASHQGYHTMVGAIDLDNIASLRLHQKCGFEEAGIIKQAGFKFDRWLDLAFYQLTLDKH
ncbi:N-acetyltransferase family protein [Photobacterium nomapromontoriensis]|uniref:GNAT family N-acetyltransferase n=1 Tax=Photobacterium nomapromontoriensis TaxID=2910237 RepID=UPI003D132AD2